MTKISDVLTVISTTDGKDKNAEPKKTTETNKYISRWVKNCSDRILSDCELLIMRKGLNFAVTPQKLPVDELVTATESACRNLNQGDASELRGCIADIIRKNQSVKHQNIGKEERLAIDAHKLCNCSDEQEGLHTEVPGLADR